MALQRKEIWTCTKVAWDLGYRPPQDGRGEWREDEANPGDFYRIIIAPDLEVKNARQ